MRRVGALGDVLQTNYSFNFRKALYEMHIYNLIIDIEKKSSIFKDTNWILGFCIYVELATKITL